MMAVIGFMGTPVPGGEAEANARSNYMWPQAVDTAKAHRTHFMVAIMGEEKDMLVKGRLFVKVMSACCKQSNILGIYDTGTVFEPQFYLSGAMMMKSGHLPLLNLIWFGLYQREGGVCGYTYGMKRFGQDEMEVLDVKGQPSEVRDFLLDLDYHVLESGITLRDGETIGNSAEYKHAIVRSQGVALSEMTLKISYFTGS